MALDLATLDLDELKTLRRNIDKAIGTFEDRRRNEARTKLEAKAREMGFTLNELADGKARQRRVNPPKYRNPDDATQTWSGRGRQPGWIKDAVRDGKPLDDFLI